MTTQELSVRIRKDTLFGTLIVSTSPRWPATVAGLGLDFVFLDTEHIALDRHELSWMCQAYGALGLPPIVRVSSPDPYLATMALDGGAAGIVAPYVETVEQVQALRGAVKCRPIKGRVLEEHLSGKVPFAGDLKEYVQRPGTARSLIVNIESIPAIENLDAILAVPDLDAVLIGPHDLSCNLGVPEQYNHPRFEEACRTIFRKARAVGIGAGVHSFYGDVAQEISWINEVGANLIIHSADIVAFAKGMSADVSRMRNASKTNRQVTRETINI